MASAAPTLFMAADKLLQIARIYYFHSLPPVILGVIYLAVTREFLINHRLHDYNTPEALQYIRPEPCTEYCDSCNPTELRFRTYDGHCNSLDKNLTGMGMKLHKFGRSALKDSNIPDPGLFEPSPYLIAEKLLKSSTGARAVGEPYSLFMTIWINLQIHDWMFHEEYADEYWTLQWGPNSDETFQLRKTPLDSDGNGNNTQTPWWDASQIYGTSQEVATSLREGGDRCELRLDANGLMPLGADGLPESGFVKNWWAGVETITTLFIKEHNYLCGQLRQEYPEFKEEELYQTARLIVAGIIARIHTVEWTPALLNNKVLNVSMHNNWEGITQAFIDQAMTDLKHSELPIEIIKAVGGLVEKGIPYARGVGHGTELNNVSYSLSEDFVSSYRMHPLIPDLFSFDGDLVAAGTMVNEKARDILEKYGISKIFDGFGHQPPTTLTLHNYPEFLTKVDIPGENGPRNMAVVDILRDRERGMPRYNQARRQYGLKPAATFEDLSDNKQWVEDIKAIYKSVEDVDYLVGVLAESPRPKGYIISETSFYVFIMNASRRLLCDRFFQEAYNADHYTQWGLDHIASTNFKSLLIRHYPELEASIGDVPGNNAFYRWQGTPVYGAAAASTADM